jgi:hypothetical protein
MPASGSNLAGHWESKPLVDISDRMMLEGRSAWNDWRPFDPEKVLTAAQLTAFRSEFQRAIEGEFNGQALFMLKDPRMSRFAPLVIDILTKMRIAVKVVIVTRHPMEVAGSLRVRDRMPVTDALLLWLRHNIEVEAATRGLDRLVLSYEALIQNPEASIPRLMSFLGPVAPPASELDLKAARASLRSELRHHEKREIASTLFPPAGFWASAACAALGALERDERDSGARAALDRLHVEIDEDAKQHGDRIGYFIGALRRAQIEILDLMRQRDNEIKQRDDEAERNRQLRRAAIVGLADSRRCVVPMPSEMPKSVSPWRLLPGDKRRRVLKRKQDFLALLASPLFDADHYVRVYPDVAAGDMPPALHYLMHGSDEGRSPCAIVDPTEVKVLFPELAECEGNLVLNLIALRARKHKTR